MWRPGICGFPCERGSREYPTDRDHQRQRPIRNAPSRGATSVPGYALHRRSPSRSSSCLSRVLTLIVAPQEHLIRYSIMVARPLRPPNLSYSVRPDGAQHRSSSLQVPVRTRNGIAGPMMRCRPITRSPWTINNPRSRLIIRHYPQRAQRAYYPQTFLRRLIISAI